MKMNHLNNYPHLKGQVRFEVLTVVKIHVGFSWVLTLYILW